MSRETKFILDTWTLSIHTEESRVQAVKSALTSEDLESTHWEEINEAVKGCPEIIHRDLRGLEKRLQAESWGLLMFKISKEGEEPPGASRSPSLRYKDGHLDSHPRFHPSLSYPPCLLSSFHLALTSKYYIFFSFILVILLLCTNI